MRISVSYSDQAKAISGWVGATEPELDTEASVRLYHHDNLICSSNAINLREDVKNAGHHPTGRCGFAFHAINHDLREGSFYLVKSQRGEQSAQKSIFFGSKTKWAQSFEDYQIFPRDDFSVQLGTVEELFSSGEDIINYKKLMIRLRRGKRAYGWRGTFKGHDYKEMENDWLFFKSYTETHITEILQLLHPRSLWSIVDTFVDFADPIERMAALAISNMMYQERFAQTYRQIYDVHPKENPILEGQSHYWGYMATNQLLRDDAYDVFLTKNIECLELAPLMKCFFIEIMHRAHESNESILRMNIDNSEYFRDMFNFYKAFLKRCR